MVIWHNWGVSERSWKYTVGPSTSPFALNLVQILTLFRGFFFLNFGGYVGDSNQWEMEKKFFDTK